MNPQGQKRPRDEGSVNGMGESKSSSSNRGDESGQGPAKRAMLQDPRSAASAEPMSDKSPTDGKEGPEYFLGRAKASKHVPVSSHEIRLLQAALNDHVKYKKFLLLLEEFLNEHITSAPLDQLLSPFPEPLALFKSWHQKITEETASAKKHDFVPAISVTSNRLKLAVSRELISLNSAALAAIDTQCVVSELAVLRGLNEDLKKELAKAKQLPNVKCSVCHDDEQHCMEMRALPCGHALCVGCINDLQGRTIQVEKMGAAAHLIQFKFVPVACPLCPHKYKLNLLPFLKDNHSRLVPPMPELLQAINPDTPFIKPVHRCGHKNDKKSGLTEFQFAATHPLTCPDLRMPCPFSFGTVEGYPDNLPRCSGRYRAGSDMEELLGNLYDHLRTECTAMLPCPIPECTGVCHQHAEAFTPRQTKDEPYHKPGERLPLALLTHHLIDHRLQQFKKWELERRAAPVASWFKTATQIPETPISLFERSQPSPQQPWNRFNDLTTLVDAGRAYNDFVYQQGPLGNDWRVRQLHVHFVAPASYDTCECAFCD